MKYRIIFLSTFSVFTLLLLGGCIKEQSLEPTNHLKGKTFNKFLKVKGHEFDSLIIEDCVFDGGGLNIGEADNILIKNCTFKNIKNNALKLGFIGAVKHIIVDCCTFENIGYNAVDSHEDALNCVIRNCSISKTALSDVGPAMAQAHHGIYWKGKNVLIENNFIDCEAQNFGNAISVRSSGTIRKNIIKYSPKNGIMYFSNHPGGDTLLIENNFLINNNYSITVNTAGNEPDHNENVIIRFNSMTQEKNPSIQVDERFENTTYFAVYGNIMVNPTENYIKVPLSLDYSTKNLRSNSDIGFIDSTSDLHVTSNSEAVGYCANIEVSFPTSDIDDDSRVLSTLNAGADE